MSYTWMIVSDSSSLSCRNQIGWYGAKGLPKIILNDINEIKTSDKSMLVEETSNKIKSGVKQEK